MTTAAKPSISDRLRERMTAAKRVFVLTGAGISAEFGVPTFRDGGKTAVWKGLPFDQISSRQMVERDLPAVWEWFDYRRELLKALAPNPAHHTLASWQARFEKLTIATQNVDGLHQHAGSENVIELHGSIWRCRCLACQSKYEIGREASRPDGCVSCGEPVRPDVVLFGEWLPEGAFERAAEAAGEADLCFVIGTSSIVFPAASLPQYARSAGAYLCEVNPERTALSDSCDEVLTGKAGELLPLL